MISNCFSKLVHGQQKWNETVLSVLQTLLDVKVCILIHICDPLCENQPYALCMSIFEEVGFNRNIMALRYGFQIDSPGHISIPVHF